jgi:hypothetical protein
MALEIQVPDHESSGSFGKPELRKLERGLARKRLPELEHRRKEISPFLDPTQSVRGLELDKSFGLRRAPSRGANFGPLQRCRNPGSLARSQRVNTDRALEIDVLAPVDENFSGSQLFSHLGYNSIGRFELEIFGAKSREVSRISVGGPAVQGQVNVQTFLSRRLWKGDEAVTLQKRLEPERNFSAFLKADSFARIKIIGSSTEARLATQTKVLRSLMRQN